MKKDLDERTKAEGIWAEKIDRRRFLRGMMVAGAGLLAACAGAEIATEPALYATPTPFRALESPQAPGNQPEEEIPEGSIGLSDFLAFSSLLTGVSNLDPNLGRIYLEALREGGGSGGPSLADVYGAASSGSGPLPQDIDALSSAGFFDQEGFGEVADQILEMWYTGVYTIGEEQFVATFVDALAWKVLHFTKPLTICGQFGFWSTEPQVELSPAAQYTPAPTPAGGGGGGG